jgi:hypothetical protein
MPVSQLKDERVKTGSLVDPGKSNFSCRHRHVTEYALVAGEFL